MSTIRLIGKSTLGELGLCQSPTIMRGSFWGQFEKVAKQIPSNRILMTSMTNYDVIEATNGIYLPQVRLYTDELESMFLPREIYYHCVAGRDSLRPIADFIVCDRPRERNVALTTFSREAPILAFESNKGHIGLGTVLRKSLIAYGDYLFKNIVKAMDNGKITVSLVACNHYSYPEGRIPDLVKALAKKYDMNYKQGIDSENAIECYHRGEKGNHVVAMW